MRRLKLMDETHGFAQLKSGRIIADISQTWIEIVSGLR